MDQIPSQAWLRTTLHETFTLQDDHGATTHVTLSSVESGIQMDAQHVCYSAVFALPANTFASQGTYLVRHASGEHWRFFLVPIRPDVQGRARLEAVFHYRAAMASDTQSSASFA